MSRNNSQDPKTIEAIAFDALCKEKGVCVNDLNDEPGEADGIPQIVVCFTDDRKTLAMVSGLAAMSEIPVITTMTANEANLVCCPGHPVFAADSKDSEHIFSLAEKVMLFRDHFYPGVYEESDLTRLASRPAPLEERM